jgi:hypothetical protein
VKKESVIVMRGSENIHTVKGLMGTKEHIYKPGAIKQALNQTMDEKGKKVGSGTAVKHNNAI